jgi:hypothetical protein
MIPGPPEVLPRRPEAIVDLQTDEGAALVGARWRYADARVEEIDFVALAGPDAADPPAPGDVPNRTYDVVAHAEAADYDDSGWDVLAPGETRRSSSPYVLRGSSTCSPSRPWRSAWPSTAPVPGQSTPRSAGRSPASPGVSGPPASRLWRLRPCSGFGTDAQLSR